MQQPLVQTQVIPYLRELVKGGHELELLTFEPDDPGAEAASIREGLDADGIKWHSLRYHKRPSVPATLFDIANGARLIMKLCRRGDFDILHARAHIPMMMAYFVRKVSGSRAKLLFDIRGFVPEEYVDAAVWPEDGLVYRSVKRFEKSLMAEADGFVVLTEAARDILFPGSRETGVDRQGRPIAVIPCCVDFGRRFSGDRGAGRARVREALGINGRTVFAHVGALGGLYLTEEIADLLSVAREQDPGVFALFLTQSDPNRIIELLKERGFSDRDYYVRKVPAIEVEDYLYASDVGLSFVMATFATKSRSPTKIPEYLAAGLPIIANPGVGDVDALLRQNAAGFVLGELSNEEYAKAVQWVSDNEKNHEGYRHLATARFSLETVGGPKYSELYERLVRPRASNK